MRKSAILFNVLCGGLVNELALLRALKFREIHGAALDAMEFEPPTHYIYSEYFEFDNVIITSYIGASMAENQSQSGIEAAETVFAVLEGTGEPGCIV